MVAKVKPDLLRKHTFHRKSSITRFIEKMNLYSVDPRTRHLANMLVAFAAQLLWMKTENKTYKRLYDIHIKKVKDWYLEYVRVFAEYDVQVIETYTVQERARYCSSLDKVEPKSKAQIVEMMHEKYHLSNDEARDFAYEILPKTSILWGRPNQKYGGLDRLLAPVVKSNGKEAFIFMMDVFDFLFNVREDAKDSIGRRRPLYIVVNSNLTHYDVCEADVLTFFRMAKKVPRKLWWSQRCLEELYGKPESLFKPLETL